MARTWLHRVLEAPAVYRLAQKLLAPGTREIDTIYDEVFGSADGRVLDVGSGPKPDTPLPRGTLVGLDVNPAYVRQYVDSCAEARPDCEKLGVVASAAAVPFADGTFDECRSAAVLHHLPDDLAIDAIREMGRTVRPGGRVAIFDMVWPRSFASAPVGWLICRFDRGDWVRREEQLEGLARKAFPGDWTTRGFSYSWFRLRGLFLILQKPR